MALKKFTAEQQRLMTLFGYESSDDCQNAYKIYRILKTDGTVSERNFVTYMKNRLRREWANQRAATRPVYLGD